METPARHKRRNRSKTTEILLRAAVDCIIEYGPAALTITAVAQRASYDKVLIYRYFGSLDGLKEAIAGEAGLYPSAAEVIGAARGVRGNPLKAVAAALQRLIEAMPLARALVIHRWHAGNDPLAGGLAQARAQWLSEMVEAVRSEWPDPQALGTVQLLAEEAAATGEDLAWRFRATLQLADGWQWPPDSEDRTQPVALDTLPDNLL